MEEDLKIKIEADLKKAERDIKNLEKIEPKVNMDVLLQIRNKHEKLREIKELQKEIALVKINPGAFPDGELKKLSQQLKQTKEELKGMKSISTKSLFKESYEDARKLAEKVKEIKLSPKSFSPEDIRILRSEIDATVLKAKGMNFAEGNSKTQGLVNNLANTSKELDKISGQVGYTKTAFGIMDVTIGNLAGSLATRVLGGMKDVVSEAAKFNRQMESATEKVRTISSSGGAEIDGNIWRMAKNTGVNPLELKEGLYQVVSAIGDTHKKYSLLETSSKLATTGFSSTTEAVDGLTTVLNAYNLEIEDADRIANIFVRTQKVGKLTVQEFNRELYKTIPVAKELKIGVDEVGASIALLTAKGSKAEIAQTQMGAFMYELLDVGSDISKLFEKIAGQSLDDFMSNGGDFEGVLRLLKGYSSENNFKMESLLGRKEAKSFWLNVGNDIDGYIDKLKAINEPINEVQRNFENLLNTKEKRLDRASNYWLAFQQTIGGVANEALAITGDFVTGADTEIAARQRVNTVLMDSLKTYESLADKQKKTKEEQEEFNKALEKIKSIAPDLFLNLTTGIDGFKSGLSLAREEIQRLKLDMNNLTQVDLQKSEWAIKAEIAKLDNDIVGIEGGFLGHKKILGIDDSYNDLLKKSEIIQAKAVLEKQLEEIQLQKQKNEEVIKELELKKKIADIEKELNFRNNAPNQSEQFKKDTKRLEETLAYLKNEVKTEVSPEVKETKEVNGNYTNWDSKYKELEINRQKDLIQAKQTYTKDLSLATEETRPKIDENYQNKVAKVEDDAKIAKLEIEINELKARIEKTSDTSAIEAINNQINSKTLEKDDVQANADLRELENKKNQEKMKKNENEKQIKLQEQNIKNDFSDKRIEAERRYQEGLKEMEGSFSQERYNKLKEEREKELALINTDEKISLLKLKKAQLNPKKDASEITALDNEIVSTKLSFDNVNLEKETKDRIEGFQESISSVTRNLNNLSKVFEATGNKTASNVMKGASAVFDSISGMDIGILDKMSQSLAGVSGSSIKTGLESFGSGMGIGSGMDAMVSGGSQEGQIGSAVGSGIGAAVGSVVPGIGTAAGAIVGGAIGGATGGLFGNKKKKKAKREKKKYEAAQRRLEEGRVSGQYTFQDTMEAFNEELERGGLGDKIEMFDQVSKNTNYDDIKTSLTGGAKGPDGVSISTLKELMPHMSEQEIIDWFKATTGGAVIDGDTVSTGEGKYGAIDLGAMAQQITEMNRELEASLKETIKNIIDFSADKISDIVKGGFGDGIDDLADNLEKAVADSLKNAFLQTEIAKGLFNGLSDKVTDMITDMFKNDKNLGIDLDINNLQELSIQEYIELIKKYMELGNDKLGSIFEELGLSLDNLNNTVDKANKNSKNGVQGMSTNLWLQNLGKMQQDIIDEAIDSNNRTFSLMNENKNLNLNSTKNLEKDIGSDLENVLKNLKIEIPDVNVASEFQLFLDGKALDSKILKVLQVQTTKTNRNKMSIIRG